MYYLILIILIIFCGLEYRLKDFGNRRYKFAFIALTLLLCLRFGQGTDYFTYVRMYYTEESHGEIGYKVVSKLFFHLGIPFEGFIICISLFMMLCIHKAIMKYSPYKTTSLLLLFPTIYLTYFFSGIRQAIVIAFFIGYMLDWLKNNKMVSYIAACILMATMHTIALLLIPLIFIKWINIRSVLITTGIAFAGGFFIYIMPKTWLQYINIGAFEYYIDDINISWFGLMERVFMMLLISFLFFTLQRKTGSYLWIRFLYKVYGYGFMLSIIFFPWAMMSSRFGAPMKAVEILLIPILLKENRKWKQLMVCFIISYTCLMTAKNLASYVIQGDYKGYNAFTYPYISIFEKDLAKNLRKTYFEP